MDTELEDVEMVFGPDKSADENDSWLTRLDKLWVRMWGNFIIFFSIFGVWIFIYLCSYQSFWPFAILYISWIYYDRYTPYRGGRKFNFMRKLRFWKINRTYFPMKLVKTCELPAEKNYLFAAFPHGVICYGVQYNIMSDGNDFDKAFPGLDPHIATINIGYYFPFFRDVELAFGTVSASPTSIKTILNGPSGSVCVILVGGVQESINSTPGPYRLVLRKRKGFVKLALESGVSLVPVFSFGEINTFTQSSSKFYKRYQEKLWHYIRYPVGKVCGRGYFQNRFGILPRRVPITTVVGKPIALPKVDNPSEELVNEYHGKFIEELEKLFEKYKGKYDTSGNDATLIIE